MGRAAKKAAKAAAKPHLTKSVRHVLPLERRWWSAVYEHGTITVSAIMWKPDYRGCFSVALTVWDADDTGYDRWTDYDTPEEAEAAYRRAVEEVTLAPNPLPRAWLAAKGLIPG
jgi:hypothetical protein